jgi:hypothetical protein
MKKQLNMSSMRRVAISGVMSGVMSGVVGNAAPPAESNPVQQAQNQQQDDYRQQARVAKQAISESARLDVQVT